MYIVANMVFYTCGKLNVNSSTKLSQLNYKSQFKHYWFKRLEKFESDYLEISIETKDIFELDDLDKFNIDKLVLKIHKSGISSLEIFLNQVLKDNFDTYFDDIISDYSSKISSLIYDINIKLNNLNLIEFPENYKFSTLDVNSHKEELLKSYIFRVHYFTNSERNYKEIVDFYLKEKILSKNTIIDINRKLYEVNIYKESIIWNNKDINFVELSQLLDIDSKSMNESVIYKQVGEIYTDLMYKMDFKKNNQVKSNILFEMHKTNSYFLQKCKLNRLNDIENIDAFIKIQKEIEQFDILEDVFNKSEKNYLDICDVVSSNEKVEASKTVQYILVFLTLLTIISVSQAIIDFINLDFGRSHSLQIDFISKVELVAFLLVCILFIFMKIREYIKKS